MTDNEIVKALECCFDGYCESCVFNDDINLNCKDRLVENALNLIERQKAEIDVLKTNNNSLCITLQNRARVERAEAIKEFAERLKARYVVYDNNVGAVGKITLYKDIDRLVKEMVGD